MPFDRAASAPAPSVRHQPARNWQAELSLGFVRTQDRTILATRRHRGPLIVQKPLYPEGAATCHAVLVHAPGGVAGGDHLALDVTVGSGAHAVITTPAATKWYRSGGVPASQDVRVELAAGALLEHLPQEAIVFNGADARMTTSIALAADSAYAGWEFTVLGRTASGERFNLGRVGQALRIERAGAPVWYETARIDGGGRTLLSPVGLSGFPVFGTFIVARGAVPEALSAACRAIAADGEGKWGLTVLPEIFVARYLGARIENGRHWFERLWTLLRPWYSGRAAVRPRIWST